jgi:methylated-DNA-[protein]-cysteine S-methyltransferase
VPVASYSLAQTAHGPWWYAWTDDGVCAAAQGELSESEFVDRLDVLGLAGVRRSDDAHPPESVDFSAVRGAFRRKVLEACSRIPEGEVRTYGQLAAECGSPGAARAVGTAMAQNPVPGRVPCHRVVRGDGHLGQYSAGGSVRKQEMLIREGVAVDDGRVPIGSAE